MEKNKHQIAKIIAVASLPPYIDSNEMCYDIIIDPANNTAIPYSFFEAFYQTRLPSFTSWQQTGKITLNSEDFHRIIKSHHSYINNICDITRRYYNQILLDVGQYYKTKQLLIQPSGVSGVIHKLINTMYLSTATISTAVSTATSHISGITGTSLLGASPQLIIFVPLVGEVFFGSLERLAADIRTQPVLIVARDTCLIIPKIVEIGCNRLFPGPVFQYFGIDSPLSITSMLIFGSGTKQIMGGGFKFYANYNHWCRNKFNTLTRLSSHLQRDFMDR